MFAYCAAVAAALLAFSTPAVSDIRPIAELGPFSARHHDADIVSPKSALFHPTRPKFYVNALEAGKTVVYDDRTLKKIKSIHHFRTDRAPHSTWGKPVEGWFTHSGKYLWVTYYRWSDDPFAVKSSGFAQIDTDTDDIVRTYPTGNIPKFITADASSSQLAVTLWGENKVELYDMSVRGEATLKGAVQVGPPVHAAPGSDRDRTCGLCLRGTAFIPDSPYLVVAKMGGGGLAVIDAHRLKLVKMISGLPATPRHVQVYRDYLYVSANVSGTVSRILLKNFLAHIEKGEPLQVHSAKIGAGARTLKVEGERVYVALNNSKQLASMNLDFSGLEYAAAAPYPVGLDVKGDLVLVTSQGKNGTGGHRVGVFRLPVDER